MNTRFSARWHSRITCAPDNLNQGHTDESRANPPCPSEAYVIEIAGSESIARAGLSRPHPLIHDTRLSYAVKDRGMIFKAASSSISAGKTGTNWDLALSMAFSALFDKHLFIFWNFSSFSSSSFTTRLLKRITEEGAFPPSPVAECASALLTAVVADGVAAALLMAHMILL